MSTDSGSGELVAKEPFIVQFCEGSQDVQIIEETAKGKTSKL